MTKIDYDSLRFWADTLYRVGVIAGIIWLAINARVKVNKDAIISITKIVGDHGTRIIKLEERGANAPTHADLGKMYEAINGLRAAIAEIGGCLKAVQKSVDLLNEHHLNRREGR